MIQSASQPASLLDLAPDAAALRLRQWVAEEGLPPYRASQIHRRLWVAPVAAWSEATELPLPLRARLQAVFPLPRLQPDVEQLSTDGTRKFLWRLADGEAIESVLIPSGSRRTLCISSQAGCALRCSFCATGTMGFRRNLSAFEIAGQVREIVLPHPGEKPPNIVFMGMGEPLYNLDNVADAIDIISDNEGIGISRRRITVSTSGVVPQLQALGERTQAMLAISLHATNDPLRDVLVPLNKKFDIATLIEGIRNYPGISNARRVTFEYVMLKGVNDSPEEAKALVQLLKGIPAKINLIPFNPWPGTQYECSSWSTIEAFAAILNRAGYASPIRTPRGRDILAACGQLKSESEKVRASARRKEAALASD